MYFQHAAEIWSDYPELAAGVVYARGVSSTVDVSAHVTRFSALAAARLDGRGESALPEIQAWRRAFARMGLKPTQYRCASEALLRRFKKEGVLPGINPVIDLCNAISIAYAIPVGVFDVELLGHGLEVRSADGDERYETFSGDVEYPDKGEVVFADQAGRAHARRWTNRQSGYSAVRESTSSILVVTEAMHAGGADDVPRLVADLSAALVDVWGPTASPTSAILTPGSPRFER